MTAPAREANHHAPLAVDDDAADYARANPRVVTILDRLRMTTVRVSGDILRDIERLIRSLERRAAAEMPEHPVESAELYRAAQYLRTLFPPNHDLYRRVYLRRDR